MAQATHDDIIAALALHARPLSTATIVTLKSCPFCLAAPECDAHFHGQAVIYCDNDDCPAAPQITAASLVEAERLWNHRHHVGYTAPEVHQ